MRVHIRVNGARREVDIAAHETLLSVLRERLHVHGVKLGCGRGECGSCTVMLQRENEPRRSVYACLTLAAACDGASVTSVEGLGGDTLHPLQEAFIVQDAVQCGFCTPGQILAAAALLQEHPDPTDEQIRTAMSGNLCRCGTYPKIVRAIQDAAARIAHG